MTSKTPKVQLTVWDAKERLSEELLKLPMGKRVAYIIGSTRDIVKDIKRKRKLNKV
jgi:hypothetical protein